MLACVRCGIPRRAREGRRRYAKGDTRPKGRGIALCRLAFLAVRAPRERAAGLVPCPRVHDSTFGESAVGMHINSERKPRVRHA